VNSVKKEFLVSFFEGGFKSTTLEAVDLWPLVYLAHSSLSLFILVSDDPSSRKISLSFSK
jgi:hypothetical protein